MYDGICTNTTGKHLPLLCVSRDNLISTTVVSYCLIEGDKSLIHLML